MFQKHAWALVEYKIHNTKKHAFVLKGCPTWGVYLLKPNGNCVPAALMNS
jgi:hypothetical protein